MVALGSRIAVVMSVYNGEAHLVEQIESVLNQVDVDVTLFVRDDGSSDGSLNILADYEKKGLIRLFRGENVGVVPSFLSLVELVDEGYSYIALCDQDDIWRSEKLNRALAVMGERDQDIPQLYCSEYIFCDAEMNQIAPSKLNRTGVNFDKMLYENMVSGNTVVINRVLADAVIQGGIEGVYCHDWWIALVASALGELTYDDYPSLYYRRTGSNVSPTGNSGINLLKYRMKTFFQRKQLTCITEQLKKLEREYGDRLSEEKRETLSRFLEGGRLNKALFPRRLRQILVEEFALRILFLIGIL